MNRRGFFGRLAGVAAAVAVKPGQATPAPLPPEREFVHREHVKEFVVYVPKDSAYRLIADEASVAIMNTGRSRVFSIWAKEHA